jgi:hypothetical protein
MFDEFESLLEWLGLEYEELEYMLEANDRSRVAAKLKAKKEANKIKIRTFNTGDNIDKVMNSVRTPRQQRLAIRRQNKNKYVKNQKTTNNHLGVYDDITNTVFINKSAMKERRAKSGNGIIFSPRSTLIHEIRHVKQNKLAKALGGVQNARRMQARSLRGDDYANRPLEHDAFSAEVGKDSSMDKVVRHTIGYKKPGKRVPNLKFTNGNKLRDAARSNAYRTYGPKKDLTGSGWDEI